MLSICLIRYCGYWLAFWVQGSFWRSTSWSSLKAVCACYVGCWLTRACEVLLVVAYIILDILFLDQTVAISIATFYIVMLFTPIKLRCLNLISGCHHLGVRSRCATYHQVFVFTRNHHTGSKIHIIVLVDMLALWLLTI